MDRVQNFWANRRHTDGQYDELKWAYFMIALLHESSMFDDICYPSNPFSRFDHDDLNVFDEIKNQGFQTKIVIQLSIKNDIEKHLNDNSALNLDFAMEFGDKVIQNAQRFETVLSHHFGIADLIGRLNDATLIDLTRLAINALLDVLKKRHQFKRAFINFKNSLVQHFKVTEVLYELFQQLDNEVHKSSGLRRTQSWNKGKLKQIVDNINQEFPKLKQFCLTQNWINATGYRREMTKIFNEIIENQEKLINRIDEILQKKSSK